MYRLVALLLLAAVACSGYESVLDSGRDRVPDDAGIATDMTFERIELEGERTYEIHEEVESFKTRSHQITSLLSWERKYVHVGLDDDGLVRWIAGIGNVIEGNPPNVLYSGVFERFEDEGRQAFFEDGTVLTFGERVRPPGGGGRDRLRDQPAPARRHEGQLKRR